MSQPETFASLVLWLVGEFENATQAKEQPTWFVHIHLWHRLLPVKLDGELAIFAEQAPILQLDRPYRQRLLVLKPKVNTDRFIGQYYGFKDPSKFRGAGADPSKLDRFEPADLISLPGCTLTMTKQSDKFMARPEPESRCLFEYDGKVRQVLLGFELSEFMLKSFDRGVDPDTGKGLWGALIGPYEYTKLHGVECDRR